MGTKHSLSLFFFFLFCCFSLLSLLSGVRGTAHSNYERGHLYKFMPSKLFVFGDSYADTGNIAKTMSNSWKFPYGITFPGKPAGRFSDGRVLTDYLARFIGVRSPTPYRYRIYAAHRLENGMNFAYGGTGVFETLVPLPNMTTQIDFFQQMINYNVYNPRDLQSSVALVSLAGNDYSTFITRNASVSAQGWLGFITQVVNRLTEELKRIKEMGVKKVAVTALQPLGCLPRSTFTSSFQQCNATDNMLVNFHNQLLKHAVKKLNDQAKDSSFLILDLYSAFMVVLNNKGSRPGSTTFENPLKPCCVGTSSKFSCGSGDEQGAKMYTVCDNPEAAFFWDNVHPTQEGWRAVYLALQASLKQLSLAKS